MRMRKHVVVMLSTVLACASGAALANAPAAPADRDVTMTVIPSGVDVVKTVVQTINVPANADKLAKAKSAEPSKTTTGQDSKAAEQNAQQVAETAAEHQAGQTQQQVQQQTLQAQLAAKTQHPPPQPPRPPPPPPPTPRAVPLPQPPG